MRIRFLTSTPLNVTAGSGTFVGIRTLAGALRKAGAEVRIVAPELHLPVYTASRILFNETLRFRRDECDVTVGFDMDGYRVAGRGRHAASIKGVIADEMRHERGLTRATMAVQARYEGLHVRRADLVMTTSRYAAERLRELYGIRAPVRIVPELIDLEAWEQLLARNPGERTGGRFRVFCVCRFYPRKRLHLLLRAAARLRSRIPELEVRIAGNGPEAENLKRLWTELRLGDTVAWLGDVSQETLAKEYNRADVFCLPSVQEGFGIVFLEAMASGKPVVAARAAAAPEVVRHGLLVEPEDAEALAEALEKLYDDAELRHGLESRGREWVREFDAPRVAEQFLAELNRLQYG
ncbi:MAG: glycosyltransferase family 4 protein [Bryobacterales bacterium]|nr:glycosyltransferase family 4 protein [Bryobacterales bacterium]